MDLYISYGMGPEESYSRQLDKKVQREERPYGYTISPPPAGTDDYDMQDLQSRGDYSVREYDR